MLASMEKEKFYGRHPSLKLEDDVRSIMTPKCKEDKMKRDTDKGKIGARFAAAKIKAIAATKVVYVEQAENMRNLRTEAMKNTGSHKLTGTQKVSQELRLTKKLRQVRPARPRPPINKVEAHPKSKNVAAEMTTPLVTTMSQTQKAAAKKPIPTAGRRKSGRGGSGTARKAKATVERPKSGPSRAPLQAVTKKLHCSNPSPRA
jgi:hypothetical protein